MRMPQAVFPVPTSSSHRNRQSRQSHGGCWNHQSNRIIAVLISHMRLREKRRVGSPAGNL